MATTPAAVSALTAVRMLAAASDGSDEILGVLDGTPMLVVDLSAADDMFVDLPSWLPCVVIGVTSRPIGPAPAGVDVAIAVGDSASAPAGWVMVTDVEAEVESLDKQIRGSPQAAVVLAQVLRVAEDLGPLDALVAESLAYSTLQGGPGFASWLGNRRSGQSEERSEPEASVLVDRDDDRLTVTLSRPHVRNAVNGRMRDELCGALAIACADPSIRSVDLRGAGTAFSSGGDLDEFGSLPDPTTGHLARTSRSPARLLATIADRATAHVHGACVGAGIELAAFARQVVAAPDARFLLPEIGLGLIPGSGGTVSISRRIGRQRTAWLALRGEFIDATTAHAWGLVDMVTAGP